MKIENLTYEQLDFNMVFETPVGESEIKSYGYAGSCVTATFVNGYHYSSEDGFETTSEKKARQWMLEYNEFTKTQKSIIDFQFPELFDKDLSTIKQPCEIYGMAVRRTVKAKIISWATCTRCDGTGHYSYCSQYGTTCFKCGGQKVAFPTPTKIWKAIKQQTKRNIK